MTTAAQIAQAAHGKIISGGFMIQCLAPGHNDTDPSCKVFDGPDNQVRFHCFGGCDWRDVRAGAESLGLIEPFQPGRRKSEKSLRERLERRVQAQQQRDKEQAEQDKKAIAAANQIWGGTVHV